VRKWARGALAVALAGLSGTVAAAPSPALARGGGFLLLTHLPPILGRSEIRKQLETGLTTTLAFELRLAGGKPVGAARLDVRYEPWDEVFYVRQLDATGRLRSFSLPSFERLADWWAKAELALGAARGRLPAAAEVRLRVIPFSRAEQLETQKWLSRSLSDRDPGSAGALSGTLEKPATPLGQVLDLLLSTSIERGALSEISWKLAVPQGEAR
jgi:hypothetical protein